MTKKWVWTCLAAASLATAMAAAPVGAQAQDRGGPGASTGQRGGGGPGGGFGRGPGGGPGAVGGRNFSGAPRAQLMQHGVPRGAGARIEPRIRSGARDPRGGAYMARSRDGAAPLTITRNRPYAGSGYRGDRSRYYVRNRGYYNNDGWFPGLLAAPFLLPGALLGAGYGYDYGPEYYPYDEGYYSPGPAAYGGALGNYCATPQKTCQLYTPAEVGLGCSCRAPAGRARFRGTVVP